MALGDNCSSACTTRDHATFGECQRAKSISIGYCRSHLGQDSTRQKKWDAELNAFDSAVAQGIMPAGTSMRKIREAVEISNRTGVAYDASPQSRAA